MKFKNMFLNIRTTINMQKETYHIVKILKKSNYKEI